jgi:hypothetical protein
MTGRMTRQWFASRLLAALTVLALATACGGGNSGGSGKKSAAPSQKVSSGSSGSGGSDQAKRAKALVEKAEKIWDEAEAALAAHDLKAATAAHQKLDLTTLEGNSNVLSGAEIAPGQTVGDWFKARRERYKELLLAEVDWQMEALARGEAESSEFRNFVSYYPPYLGNLGAHYEKRKMGIAVKRARLARRWLRVQIAGANADLAEVIQKGMRSQWQGGPAGLEPRFDWAVARPEELATWGKLEVRCAVDNAQYASTSKLVHASFSIPQAISVSFNMEPPAHVETSWDQLPPIAVSETVPQTLLFDDSDDRAEAERIRDEIEAKLHAALEAKLRELPQFELFPGANPDSLSLTDANSQFDPRAARAMLVKAPARLEAELPPLLEKALIDPKYIGQVSAFLVAAGLQAHAPWVEEHLPSAKNEGRDAVKELAKAPWFGDYGPLLAIVKQKGHPQRMEALHALVGYFRESKPNAAVRALVSDPSDHDRSNIAHFIVQQASEDEIREFGAWVQDADQNFARTVFVALRNRSPELADQVMAENFAGASPELQRGLLIGFRFDRDKHGEATLRMLAAALDSPDQQTARAALSALMEASYTPTGWDILRENLSKVREEQMRAQVQSKLMIDVGRAHPDKAPDFLRQSILDSNAQAAALEEPADKRRGSEPPALWLRDTAINQYMEPEKPSRSERVSLLADLVRERPQDKRLLRAILTNLDQFAQIRQGWDFAQEDLLYLLERGLEHPEKNARQFVYNFMFKALEKGSEDYRDRLANALEKEEDKAMANSLKTRLQNVKKKKK